MLYVHSFLIRSGLSISDALRSVEDRFDSGPAARRIHPDFLHASGKITRHLPQTKRTRRSLLEAGNATQDGNSTESSVPREKGKRRSHKSGNRRSKEAADE